MLKLIISIMCITLVAPAMADEEVKPGAPYDMTMEKVTFVGLPGDDGFYEIHERKDGSMHFVDADGREYRTKGEMLAHAVSK